MTSASTIHRPVWVAAAYLEGQAARVRGIISDTPSSDQASRVLVFGEGGPKSWLDFPEVPSGQQVAEAYAEASALGRGGPDGSTSFTGPLPPCTVVVCTRERPEQLRRCLQGLLTAVRSDEEILVVDNAPTTDRTATIVAEFDGTTIPVRLVHEPAPGLSRARNAALRAATGDVVVFLDDDTVPEIGWTVPLREAFAGNPSVAIATGMVPPAQLDTAGQQLFQDRLHWCEEFSPEVYSYANRGRLGPLFPFAAGRLGTGANMAVRRSALRKVGGFDQHLGAGTASRGGEDLEMFVRCLRQGWSLAYVPESVVWHVHASDLEEVRRHVFGYGSGVTAYLTAVLTQPRRRDLLRSVGRGLRYAVAERRRSPRSAAAEEGLLTREILGFLWGPPAYLYSRMRTSHAD